MGQHHVGRHVVGYALREAPDKRTFRVTWVPASEPNTEGLRRHETRRWMLCEWNFER